MRLRVFSFVSHFEIGGDSGFIDTYPRKEQFLMAAIVQTAMPKKTWLVRPPAFSGIDAAAAKITVKTRSASTNCVKIFTIPQISQRLTRIPSPARSAKDG